VGLGASHQVSRTPSARQSPSSSSLNRSGAQRMGSPTTMSDKDDSTADATGSKFDLVSKPADYCTRRWKCSKSWLILYNNIQHII